MEGREDAYSALFAAANGQKVECEKCEGGGTTGEIDNDDNEVDCPVCDGTGEVSPECDGDKLTAEDASDRLAEYPLGLSVRRVMRVDLSTGGPGDWLEVELGDDNDVEDVTYHFNDWFDHAERRVREDSALWRAAEYYAEYAGSL
jgi:hypothetical protein